MMVDYLSGLGIWNWFIVGAVLLALEVLAARRRSCSGSALPRCWSG